MVQVSAVSRYGHHWKLIDDNNYKSLHIFMIEKKYEEYILLRLSAYRIQMYTYENKYKIYTYKLPFRNDYP